jgi:hypothetical protein
MEENFASPFCSKKSGWMKRRYVAATIAIAAVYLLAAIGSAFAAEPRPWLCRDKPVFSSERPMTYKATKRGAGRWIMTFMRFDPAGGHDGFTVVATREVSGNATGVLERGQWYAVALYRSGSHWICPENASKDESPVAGDLATLCYGDGPEVCSVRLSVRNAGSSAEKKATP